MANVERQLKKANAILDRLGPKIAVFDRLTGDTVQALKKAEAAGNKDELVKILREIELRRPLLIGKTIVSDLQRERDALFDLRNELDMAGPEMSPARPMVQDAILKIEQALRENIDALKIIDRVQGETRNVVIKIIKVGLSLIKDVVSLLTGGPSSFFGKTSQALSGLQGTIRGVGQLVNDARRSLTNVEQEVRRAQQAIKRAAAQKVKTSG